MSKIGRRRNFPFDHPDLFSALEEIRFLKQ